MSEVLVNDESLKAVANVIRQKAGITWPLVFPSGFTAAIKSIKRLPFEIDAMAVGEYVCPIDTSANLQFTHNLGVLPDVVIVFSKDGATQQNTAYEFVASFYLRNSTKSTYDGNELCYRNAERITVSQTLNTSTGFATKFILNKSGRRVFAEKKYYWAALKFKL